MKYTCADIEALGACGIEIQNFPGSGNNKIYIGENAHSMRGLSIHFSGKGNEVRLDGTNLPDGVLHIIGNRSRTHIISDAQVTLDAWLYDDTELAIDRPRAIFGLYASIFADTALTIKQGCLMASEVEIWTSDHHSLVDLDTMKQINKPASVAIEENVWLSRDCMILKGVAVGTGAIVAAKALISCDVPPYELWGGVPGKCLRRRVSWVPSHPASRGDLDRLDRISSYHDIYGIVSSKR